LRVLGKSKDGHFVLKTRLGEFEEELFGWIPREIASVSDTLREGFDARKNGSPVTQGLLAAFAGFCKLIGLSSEIWLPEGPHKLD
jgi:hypothetical protein